MQHISGAVAKGSEAATTRAEEVADYFRGWYDWLNINRVFMRMSIASAHGERDFRLPSGEERRLRIVEPLTDAERHALMSHHDSPAYIADSGTRECVVSYTGNILRNLMDVSCDLPDEPTALKAEVTRRLHRVRELMEIDCAHWLARLPTAERKDVVNLSYGLVAGDLSWIAAKGLYGAGIVYRTAGSELVRPVSAAASSAYLVAAAKYSLNPQGRRPLSSFTDGRKRGFELEERLRVRLTLTSVLVSTKLLSGAPGDEVAVQRSSVVLFDSLAEVVPRADAVLYHPRSMTFPCDGILMPSVDDETGAIVVLECSTTSPRASTRVRKVQRYLAPTGIASDLARRFPARKLIVALVYDGVLEKAPLKLSKSAEVLSGGELQLAPSTEAADCAALSPHAAIRTAAVRVVDRRSLERMGGIVL